MKWKENEKLCGMSRTTKNSADLQSLQVRFLELKYLNCFLKEIDFFLIQEE